MKLADKMDAFSPSVFVRLAEKKAEAEARGVRVVNLSVGTPDLPPAPHIVEALRAAAEDPENFKYAIVDDADLIAAACAWYARRYGVALEPNQVCSLAGSQDGLAHLPLVLLNPGDIALVPNPGYTIFLDGPKVASAENYELPLLEENGFLPDLDGVSPSVLHRANLLTISYPMNPLGKLAPGEFFEKVVWFARKYDIAILHDNAYSELTYDGRVGGSFLQTPGAAEVGVEFNSLSKSYNMSGFRISFALGNVRIIEALRRFKSNIDYGIFRPVQRAAIAALTGPQDCVASLRATYERRRNMLVESFAGAGWPITPPEATMFAWTRIPEGYHDAAEFAMELIDRAGVMVVPGPAFGSLGEGYVRIALVQPEEEILRAAAGIKEMLQG